MPRPALRAATIPCESCGAGVFVDPKFEAARCTFCFAERPLDVATRNRLRYHLHATAELHVRQGKAEAQSYVARALTPVLWVLPIFGLGGVLLALVTPLGVLAAVGAPAIALLVVGPRGFNEVSRAIEVARRPAGDATCGGCGAHFPVPRLGMTTCPFCEAAVVLDGASLDAVRGDARAEAAAATEAAEAEIRRFQAHYRQLGRRLQLTVGSVILIVFAAIVAVAMLRG